MKTWARTMLALLRAIPAGTRGKHRMGRLLLGRSLDERNVTVRAADGTSYLVPSIRASIGYSLLVDGVYEPDEIGLVLSRLREGDVFIDVGANIGCFTIPAARRVGPTGRVLAVEGSPAMHEILRHNLRLNAVENVEVAHCLALDRDGTTPFHEAPMEKFGMGCIAPQFDFGPVSLPCRTIDAIVRAAAVQRAAVMKVDVEGFEAAVFAGAAGLLRGPDPPLIVFEFVDWAEERACGEPGRAQRLLRDWGYSTWTLDAFQERAPPDREPVLSGAATLVAMRPGSSRPPHVEKAAVTTAEG